MTAAAVTATLPGWRLALFGLPGLPLAALTLPLYIYLPTYYADTLGLGLGVVGGVLLAARIWDMVTDPVVGVLADAVRLPGGRRRGWMVAGLPFTIAGIWMLMSPPDGAGAAHLLVWSIVLHLGGTMMVLSQQAWAAELSDGYDERSRIVTVREVFVILGTLAAIALPVVAGGDGTAVTAAGLATLGAAIALLLPVTTAAAVIAVPEPDRPVARARGQLARLGALVANRPFRRLIGAYIANGFANGLPATLFLLYVSHVIGRPDLAGPLLFVYFAAGILAAPLWLRLAARTSKHRAWTIAMAIATAAFLPAAFLGTGDVVPFLIICIATGATLGADLALPNAMQADVIDIDRLETGQERAGLFFALWGFATKAALALGIGTAFPLIDAAGFDPAADDGGGALALTVLALVYGALPVPFKIWAILLVRRFPLTREIQSGLAEEIARRRSPAVATPPGCGPPSSRESSCSLSVAAPRASCSRSSAS